MIHSTCIEILLATFDYSFFYCLISRALQPLLFLVLTVKRVIRRIKSFTIIIKNVKKDHVGFGFYKKLNFIIFENEGFHFLRWGTLKNESYFTWAISNSWSKNHENAKLLLVKIHLKKKIMPTKFCRRYHAMKMLSTDNIPQYKKILHILIMHNL